MGDDLLTARRAEPEKWSAIGQFTAVLDQAVGLLPYIAAEEDGGSHVQWVAYTNSLTTDLARPLWVSARPAQRAGCPPP